MFEWVLNTPLLSSIYILFLKPVHKFCGFPACCLEVIHKSSRAVIRSSRLKVFYKTTFEKVYKAHQKMPENKWNGNTSKCMKWNSFSVELQVWACNFDRKRTLLQVFSCKLYQIFLSSYSQEDMKETLLIGRSSLSYLLVTL